MSTPLQPASDEKALGKPLEGWRLRLYTIIFEADTRAGQLFDAVLIAAILLSLAVVVLDSVESVHQRFGRCSPCWNGAFHLLFTLEYMARLACVRHPALCPQLLRHRRPAGHPADLPGHPGAGPACADRRARAAPAAHLPDLQAGAYVAEFGALGRALAASRRKILVFLSVVLMVVLVMGTLMYVVEGPANGFTSIPVGVYWAITTMTTVGFGDITPKTDLGRLIASVMMLMGWGTLAVPTGIVTAEFTAQRLPRETTTPPPWPARMRDLRHGQVLNWLVDTGGLRVLHVDSADFIRDELKGIKADLVCLCAIGRRYRPGYVREVVALTQPKWIVPCHWDTMVTPIDAPPEMLPGVDLPGFLREIEDAGVQALPVPLLGSLTLPRGPFAR
jgi:voltage-gated potassium channel